MTVINKSLRAHLEYIQHNPPQALTPHWSARCFAGVQRWGTCGLVSVCAHWCVCTGQRSEAWREGHVHAGQNTANSSASSKLPSRWSRDLQQGSDSTFRHTTEISNTHILTCSMRAAGSLKRKSNLRNLRGLNHLVSQIQKIQFKLGFDT